MKKLLFLVAVSGVMGLKAQTTIQVIDSVTNVVINAGSCFTMETVPEDLVTRKFNIKNIDAVATHTYDVKRYDIILNSVPSTSTAAKARFCFAGQCYGASTYTSTTPIVLLAGQSSTALSGAGGYQLLYADLEEASSKGFSLVKYTFFNSVNPNDSLQFSIGYNGPCNSKPTGIKSSVQQVFEFEVVPNPVKNDAVLKVTGLKTEQSWIYVYNTLGSVVYKNTTEIVEGNNAIPIQMQQLPAGIYFVELKTGDKTITKKILVE